VVQYSSNLCTTGQTIARDTATLNRSVGCGGSFYTTNVNNLFDGAIVSDPDSCAQKCQNGFVGYFNKTHYIGQDFGASTPRHIRKIRYQYFQYLSNFTLRASNAADPYTSYTNILVNQSVTQGDTDYNDIILPATGSYRYWYIVFGCGSPNCILGELQMMEAIIRPVSLAYII
jgi:hypothetical protein